MKTHTQRKGISLAPFGVATGIALASLLFASCTPGQNASGTDSATSSGSGFSTVKSSDADMNDIIASMHLSRLEKAEAVSDWDFSLPMLDGTVKKLSDYKGQLVLLNFWATWCPPCRTEMPGMNTLYSDYNAKGLVVLAINLQEPKETVEPFLKKEGYTMPVMLDEQGTVGAKFDIQSIPSTFLVTPDGYIVAGKLGTQEWDTPEIRSVLDKLLAVK